MPHDPLDNLIGDNTCTLILWFFAHESCRLITPLSGLWLNMTQPADRIVKHLALDRQRPRAADEIIAPIEPRPTARMRRRRRSSGAASWHAGSERAYRRRQPLGGSGACTTRAIRRRETFIEQSRCLGQMNH
jgi:hypothetical protein